MKRKCLLFLPLLLLSSCQLLSFGSSTSSSTTTTSSSSSEVSSSTDSATSAVSEEKESLTLVGLEDFAYFDRYERFSLDSLQILHEHYDPVTASVVREDVTTDCALVLEESGKELTVGTILHQDGTFLSHFEYGALRSDTFLLVVSPVTDYKATLSTSLEGSTFRLGDRIAKEEIEVLQVISYTNEFGEKVQREEEVKDFSLFVDGKETESHAFQEEGRHTIEIFATGNDGKRLSWQMSFTLYGDDGLPIEYEDDTIPVYLDSTTMTVHVENPSRSSNVDPLGIDPTGKGYYTPEEVELAYTIYDYGAKNVYNWKYAPARRNGSLQKTPVLVVPVLVPGASLSATEERAVLSNIEQAFFGKSGDMHYESLRSYFLQSSYGQLEITGRVTDVFDAEKESSFYHDLWDLDTKNFPDLAQECADFAKDNGVDLGAYDSDRDGLIDAMWLVWVGHGYDGNTVYWPFSTSTQEDVDPGREVPVVNNIGWCGADFLTGFSPSNPVDAHVVIHETSHMLGLCDYYSYTDGTYAPLGNVDMMNQNVGDHNPYSKMLLGWKTPYLVYGNDVEIELSSSVTSGDFIVLLDDEYEFQATSDGKKALFNPFDEYLVLDYYSSQGKLSGQEYDAYYTQPIQGKGGRLHHVDNRLFSVDPWSLDATLLADSATAFTEDVLYPYKAIDNSDGVYDPNFHVDEKYGLMDEIRLIDHDGRYLSASQGADERTLFDPGDSFSLAAYRSQFLDGRMDSRKSFSTTFEIQDIG